MFTIIAPPPTNIPYVQLPTVQTKPSFRPTIVATAGATAGASASASASATATRVPTTASPTMSPTTMPTNLPISQPTMLPSQSSTNSEILSKSKATTSQPTQSNIIIVVSLIAVIVIFGVTAFICIKRMRKAPAHEVWQTHYNKKLQEAPINMHQIYSKENGPTFVPYVQKSSQGERRKSRISIHQI